MTTRDERYHGRAGSGADVDDLRMRPGDQPLPMHRPGVTSAHDLVIADLNLTTELRAGRPLDDSSRAAAIAVIEARRDLGLRRYGTVLQPDNGRDNGRDALEEAADLVVYLRNGTQEDNQSWWILYVRAVELLVDLIKTVGGVL